jgi:hypothetical protein
LKKELEKEGINDISFVIVNSHFDGDFGHSDLLRQVSGDIPVLQDTKEMYAWSFYKAEVDDMIIFDK